MNIYCHVNLCLHPCQVKSAINASFSNCVLVWNEIAFHSKLLPCTRWSLDQNQELKCAILFTDNKKASLFFFVLLLILVQHIYIYTFLYNTYHRQCFAYLWQGCQTKKIRRKEGRTDTQKGIFNNLKLKVILQAILCNECNWGPISQTVYEPVIQIF